MDFAEIIERRTIPEPNSGCLLWCGSFRKNGYGQFFPKKGVSMLAHRASWELQNGPIPTGLSILHKCDVPACVEPSHLFPGTQADNMADMVKKGRSTQGARHPNARTSESKVREIAAAVGSYREISIRFGVTRDIVSHIKQRRTWKHLWEAK
jgi:HNH endonuclease